MPKSATKESKWAFRVLFAKKYADLKKSTLPLEVNIISYDWGSSAFPPFSPKNTNKPKTSSNNVKVKPPLYGVQCVFHPI